MSGLAVTSWAIILIALAVVAFAPEIRARLRARLRSRDAGPPRHSRPDPGRERRASRRAERLLSSVVGADEYAAYRALGFLAVYGEPEEDGLPGYGYLLYPHRPIVSFDARTGEPLSELCVAFPDHAEAEWGQRLPDADDLLAKWMSLRADERRLLAEANMHLVGRQIDPAQARRDIARAGEWLSRASDSAGSASA